MSKVPSLPGRRRGRPKGGTFLNCMTPEERQKLEADRIANGARKPKLPKLITKRHRFNKRRGNQDRIDLVALETPTQYLELTPQQIAMATAELCRMSFYDFVQAFWHTIIHGSPVWNWHMEFLCDELQASAERVFRGEKCPYDTVINIPPGTSKSTICSVRLS